MRVKWEEAPDPPWEQFGKAAVEIDPNLLVSHYIGEVIGVVNSFFGGTKLVVMLDSGRTREVDVSMVRRAD